MGKMIKTNMGTIPIEDYLDIMSMQYGFDDYKDLKEHGMSIDCPEADEYEKEQREKSTQNLSIEDKYPDQEEHELEDR